MQQEPPPPPPLLSGIDGFAECVAALLRTIYGRNYPVWPVMLPNAIRPVLSTYICGYTKRFAAIAARWRAGTLRRHPVRAPRDPDAAPVYNQPPTPRPRHTPPHTFGWLAKILLWHGNAIAGEMHRLIRDDPEIRALLEAAPQLTRILRPLLRAFARKIEPDLLPKLPKGSPRRKRFRLRDCGANTEAGHKSGLSSAKARAQLLASFSANPQDMPRKRRSRRTLDPRTATTQPDGALPPHRPDKIPAGLLTHLVPIPKKRE